MSSSLFRVDEHVLSCQHIRQYPYATISGQEEDLCIAIKQYTPLDNPNPKPGDVTIIGAHANGFPKELYEPLWDELLKRAERAGFSIRSIWTADVAQQGQSGVLNEEKLGNDPSWFDHPRDLLHMVNHFRGQIQRPIVGVGHSMGGNNLVNLSLIHPRLFETLVLIDPVVQRVSSAQGNYMPAQSSAFRRDRWPSREVAMTSYKRSKFYQTWDPRVIDLWVKYGLRDLPTALYPDAQTPPLSAPTTTESTVALSVPADKEVTLTTTKHQEVFTFLRPAFPEPNSDALVASNRLTHPDIDRTAPQAPFYRPEPIITFHNLPHLRPSVLYLFGSLSALSAPDMVADKMAITGTGVGGSGGAAEGKVREITLEGVGHLIPMEAVEKTAELVAEHVGREVQRWRRDEEVLRREWDRKSVQERRTMSREFLERISDFGDVKRKARVEKL